MTAMAEEIPRKKPKKAEPDPEKLLHAVEAIDEAIKQKAKPGAKGYDWQQDYPGKEVFVYTVPADAKRSPVGMTIGLTKLDDDEYAPYPGRIREALNEGGLKLMFYFIEVVSTPASLKLQSQLHPREYNVFVKQWADWAGIELSE